MATKYADFINEQNSSEANRKYTGWVSDPKTGKGTAVDTEHNIYRLPQKPSEQQFAMGENEIAPAGDFKPIQDPYYSINVLPDQELKIAMAAIENEYQINNHKAIQTSTNTAQVDTFLQNAKMLHDMKVQEAVMKYKRMKLMFTKYDQDNTLSQEDSLKAKIAFKKSNPIFDVPEDIINQQKPTFIPQYIETHLGKIATGDFPKDIAEENISDREKALKTAERVFNTDPNHLMPEVLQEINNNYPKEQEKPQGENIFSKIGKALSQAIQHPKDWFTDDEFMKKAQGQQETKQSEQIQQTPKPKGYPDAVFNKQYGMWTVIKNGKLVGLKGVE
jgi:hypothetical protein